MDIPTFEVAVAVEGMDPDQAAETGKYDVIRVLCLGPDQMAAERMAKRLGFKTGKGEDAETLSLALTYLMVYMTLHRRGVLPGEWSVEKPRLLSLEAVDPPAAVDPTPPADDMPSPLP